jgi:hypothetical protein
MPSTDQVRVNNPHSTMRWHKWVAQAYADQAWPRLLENARTVRRFGCRRMTT